MDQTYADRMYISFCNSVSVPSSVDSFRLSVTGEIVQGQNVDIICDVTARPSESDITITNIYTNTLIKEIKDSQSMTYTFSSVHVLNSGLHQCSTINGIGSADTRNLTMDVKGMIHVTVDYFKVHYTYILYTV